MPAPLTRTEDISMAQTAPDRDLPTAVFSSLIPARAAQDVTARRPQLSSAAMSGATSSDIDANPSDCLGRRDTGPRSLCGGSSRLLLAATKAGGGETIKRAAAPGIAMAEDAAIPSITTTIPNVKGRPPSLRGLPHRAI